MSKAVLVSVLLLASVGCSDQGAGTAPTTPVETIPPITTASSTTTPAPTAPTTSTVPQSRYQQLAGLLPDPGITALSTVETTSSLVFSYAEGYAEVIAAWEEAFAASGWDIALKLRDGVRWTISGSRQDLTIEGFLLACGVESPDPAPGTPPKTCANPDGVLPANNPAVQFTVWWATDGLS